MLHSFCANKDNNACQCSPAMFWTTTTHPNPQWRERHLQHGRREASGTGWGSLAARAICTNRRSARVEREVPSGGAARCRAGCTCVRPPDPKRDQHFENHATGWLKKQITGMSFNLGSLCHPSQLEQNNGIEFCIVKNLGAHGNSCASRFSNQDCDSKREKKNDSPEMGAHHVCLKDVSLCHLSLPRKRSTFDMFACKDFSGVPSSGCNKLQHELLLGVLLVIS